MKNSQILKKYADFADMDRDSGSLKKKAIKLIDAAADALPTFKKIGDQAPGTFAQDLHKEINKHITSMSAGEPAHVNVDGFQIGSDGDGVYFSQVGGGIADEICTMYQLMLRSGVKGIIRCPGCGKCFLRIKGRKLTCSGTCRQRIAAANRTPEQKELAKLKRRQRNKK